MKIHDEFGSISELIGIDPRGFIISAFVTCPSDKIFKLAAMSVVNLGIEDVRDFKLGLVFDNEGWGRRLNPIWNWIRECWFQH